MTAPLPKDIADKLEKHIIREMKARLTNWGRWWRSENSLEIRWDTGQITRSPSYRLMQHGKVSSKSGYATPHRMPINDQDALDLHKHILTLSSGDASELRRFYSDEMGSGTGAQKTARHRAIRKLAGFGG